jgi:hypothetical protein
VLREWWNKITGHDKYEAELETMTPAERAYVEETPEDRAADYATREHLGGGDPELRSEIEDEGRPLAP